MAPMGAPPKGNAALIRVIGILSYNQRHRFPVLEKLVSSIADPSVNQRRDWRKVGDRSLHDFVPFYWATHTPMQYVQTIRDKVISQDDLVFFVCDAEEILELPRIWTSDGNAASRETSVPPGRGAEPLMDWKIINTWDCRSKKYKRKKCAEVLVPDLVPPELIKRICVYSDAARAELDRRTDILRTGELAGQRVAPVEVCRDVYYP
jgi:hypothetical protein